MCCYEESYLIQQKQFNKYIKFYKNDKKLTDQFHKLSSWSNI